MSDSNKDAIEIWNLLKPMIDSEIQEKTRGMVQRRKMKVTTAPSLVTNTIGVTDPFGQELFIPFVTNLYSATVGDVVWVEYMYGATNMFASCYAAVGEKDYTVAGDLNVVGDIYSNGTIVKLFFTKGTAIAANDDLHTYTTPGVYYATASVAATVTNSSITTVGFKLYVIPHNTGLCQIELAQYDNCIIALQYFNGSSWRGWKRLTPS